MPFRYFSRILRWKKWIIIIIKRKKKRKRKIKATRRQEKLTNLGYQKINSSFSFFVLSVPFRSFFSFFLVWFRSIFFFLSSFLFVSVFPLTNYCTHVQQDKTTNWDPLIGLLHKTPRFLVYFMVGVNGITLLQFFPTIFLNSLAAKVAFS